MCRFLPPLLPSTGRVLYVKVQIRCCARQFGLKEIEPIAELICTIDLCLANHKLPGVRSCGWVPIQRRRVQAAGGFMIPRIYSDRTTSICHLSFDMAGVERYTTKTVVDEFA